MEFGILDLMKKVLVWGNVLSLLALDWAALDDITTGNEPNFFLEYTILLISVLVFGSIGFVFLKKRGVRDLGIG